MASITLSGTLLDPSSKVAIGDEVRFTHRTTTGSTVQSAQSSLTIGVSGAYSIQLQYGLILVEYKDYTSRQFKNLGVVTVNQDSTATSLPELLNAIVPPTDAQLLEFQAILADCVAAQVAAEAAASISEAFANQLTTTELIASTEVYASDVVLQTSGFTVSGSGSGSWKQNGVTGQTPSRSPAQLGDALLNDGNGNQWGLVVNGPINVLSLGVVSGTNSTLQFQSCISSGETVLIDANTNLVITSTSIAWASATTFIVYGTVNGDSDCLELKGGNKLIFNAERKRNVIRSTNTIVNGYEDEKASKAGSSLRVDGEQSPGGSVIFLNTNDRKPVVAATDFVMLHSVQYNGASTPKMWGYNPVIVKDVNSVTAGSSTSSYGIEVSISNNTAETGVPLAINELTGIFCSYINLTGTASAAFTIGGLSSGWEHGLYIDAIKSDGTAIKLADDVNPNSGMRAGLDTTAVNQFTSGAVLLGNTHKIVGKNTVNGNVPIAEVNGANEVALGNATNDMRLNFSDLKVTGGVVGASAAFPANYDATLFVTINGTNYKLPLIAV